MRTKVRRGVQVAHKNPSWFPNPRNPHPPGAWIQFRRKLQSIVAPVERFLAVEAASGIVLMTAAVLALMWANSPWRMAYLDLWQIPFGLRFGHFRFERDLHFWINDGLMTVFFFVVGLEIRREMHAGELSDVRRAALPAAAAFGGMIAPAIIFLAFNVGRAGAAGWAVPVATDIAFAVGALALLGKRVSPAMRILLLALAVIDDVGAIVVIAIFYSTQLSAAGFAVMSIGILLTFAFQILGVRSSFAYLLPGSVTWFGAYTAGIHPALAGVVMGLMTPLRAWYGPANFLDETEAGVLRVGNREAVSPVERLEHVLHGWVAFGIMPLFAFANAGVPLGEVSLAGDLRWVFWGVLLGLAVGKPIGIGVASWISVRLRVAALPRGVRLPHIAIVGMVGGIGFTMALFIAELAFPAGLLLETAKLAVLCGSVAAGVLSLFVGSRALKPASAFGSAKSEAEAERSN